MSLFRRFECLFEPVCIVAALSTIVILVFTNVVLRLFDTTLAWAGELARYLFVWMIYLGISYCIRERRHLRVTFLVDRLPGRAKAVVNLLADVVFMVYSAMVAYYGYLIMSDAVERGQIAPALEISVSVLYAAIVVGGALSVGRLAVHVGHSWQAIVASGDGS
ncbi:TRAP transporter small permease [Halomonas sp. V046]|uniref:TRAP transporter small permease n=1 Tax=Halomonas sp. V046 TaxID=3459611 RepID=UPI004044B46E